VLPLQGIELISLYGAVRNLTILPAELFWLRVLSGPDTVQSV
jgi:hypothetical protein